MKAMLTNLHFYEPTDLHTNATISRINKLRKEFLGFAIEESKKITIQCEETSPSVTIRIDTPVLRSERPHHVHCMSSKANNAPQKFFPNARPTKPPLPGQICPPRIVPNMILNMNLNRSFRRMSIAKKKLDRGLTLVNISLFKVQAEQQNNTENENKTHEIRKEKIEISEKAAIETKKKKREKIRKALNFLKEYGLSLKSYMRTILNIIPKAYSPEIDRMRPPIQPKAKHESSMKVSPSSNNSTKANSPIQEDRKRPEAKKVGGVTIVAMEKLIEEKAKTSAPKREKKRRYTTPDENTELENDLKKSTYAAIEKLAFEPLIK